MLSTYLAVESRRFETNSKEENNKKKTVENKERKGGVKKKEMEKSIYRERREKWDVEMMVEKKYYEQRERGRNKEKEY